jgi:gliding motility-associated-like protein
MKTYIVFFFIITSVNLIAQNETINWYFGNKAAINFDKGKLEVLSNSEMNAPAGSASISNEDGLLMFYADGGSIWNRNHEIMENGEGLAGDQNNFQSTIIIPKPGNENVYYLFYSRLKPSANPLATAGTFYAEIEFSAASPLGSVTRKNAFLDSDSPSERFTAVHHKSGESFWLVTLNSEDSNPESLKSVFKVYHITEDGLNTNDVETELDFGIVNLGSMKLSVDGKHLFATAYTNEDRLRYVFQFQFNNENGEITFLRTINIESPGSAWPTKGIEISPNGQYIYISFESGSSNGIFQYELSTSGVDANPRAVIYFRPNTIIESLQLANDQKIYAALSFTDSDSNFLGVIEEPNEKGFLANYRPNFIELSPGASKRGLPNFIQSYFASKVITENKCYVEEFAFSAESYAPISNVVWDFGDGTTEIGLNTTHTYASPGEYTVQGILTVGSKKVTIYKLVNAYPLPVLLQNQELTECDTDFDGLSIFNLNSIREKITNPALNEELLFYVSQDDLENNIPIQNAENFNNTVPNQEIFVKVINQNDCFNTTSFKVISRFVELGAIADVFVCEDSDGITGNNEGLFETTTLENNIRNQLGIASSTSLSFYPTYVDAQTNLNQFSTQFSSKSSTIFIKAKEADFSCGGIQSFNIIVNSEPIINLQDSYTICFNPNLKPEIMISAAASNDSFEWRNSAGTIINTNQDFILNSVGEFSLTVYKTENGLRCSNTKTFNVVNPEPPSFSNILVNTEDQTNNIVDVFINGNSNYEFSLDNINFSGRSTSFTFSDVAAGVRTIYARDINECEQSIQSNVSVIGFKKFFTPNGDGENDFWNINGLDQAFFKSIDVSIFNRYGKVVGKITDFTSPGWNGTFNGKLLASNNYWFKATIVDNDNKIIKETGNFSLIRN